jgi:acyl-CoA reductase-like NAD-dependent aldehyde dehydrogenase
MTAVASESKWASIADELHPSGRAFIDGKLVEAASGRTFTKSSPVDGRSLASVAEGDEQDVDAAVRAARASFESGVWSACAPRDRKTVLLRLAALIHERREQLAVLSTLEMGKPVSDSLGEVELVVQCITYYAEAIDKVYGEVGPTRPDSLALVLREPIGVIAAVTPWNYPLLMPAWKIAPALAAGNSMVLKPAEQAPLSSIALGELAAEAEIPAGVLDIVPGFGETAGAAVGRHMDVDAVAFTGSGEVGKAFLRYAGESNMKAVSLECGGKSPHVVLADAPDLGAAAEAAAEGIFINAGQMCNAGSRIIVERQVEQEFVGQLLNASAKWAPRHPFESDARMGAMVDEVQRNRVEEYIETGRTEGATLLTGGGRALEETGGLYLQPTIFSDAQNGMRIAREEIFGPVVTILTADDVEEAIRTANSTDYGLAAGIWTRDIARAVRAARAFRAGNVYVNCYDRGDIALPFGGYKQSGIGVDKSLHALEKYTKYKSVWIQT